MNEFKFDGSVEPDEVIHGVDPDDAIENANRHTKGNRKKFREFLHNVGVLGRMAKAVASGEYVLQTQQIALLFGTLGYVASPVDLIPEAFLGPLGLGDDAAAAAVAVSLLAYEIACFLEWEQTNKGGGEAEAA